MAGSDTVRLVDDQTFEMLDRFGLEPMELGVSLASMAFAEDDRTYYVIGTAFTEPDEAESKKVRSSYRAAGNARTCPAEVKKYINACAMVMSVIGADLIKPDGS